MSEIKMRDTVRHVVAMLVEGDFDGLERLSRGRRLSAAEMAGAVADYGEALVMPPNSAFEDIDVIEVEGAGPREWDARMALWTAEGEADLTLELTLRDDGEGLYDVQIDNLHVL